MLAPDRIWLQVLQNVYISLPYIMAARTAGIDRNEEITSLSTYAYKIRIPNVHTIMYARLKL